MARQIYLEKVGARIQIKYHDTMLPSTQPWFLLYIDQAGRLVKELGVGVETYMHTDGQGKLIVD